MIRYELKPMVAPREEMPSAPFKSELPESLGWLRLVAYMLFFAVLTVLCVQFHLRVARDGREVREIDGAYYEALAAYESDPSESNRAAAEKALRGVLNADRHRGAIARWARAVRRLWAGESIYRALPNVEAYDPLTGRLRPGAVPVQPPEPKLGAPVPELTDRPIHLHPNMPFVTILLSAFAYVPPQAAAAGVNLLKILALLGAIFAAAAAVNHGRHRMDEWVVGLAMLFALPLIISEFQHGNTNMFVLTAIAVHLWLYRRGSDLAAGLVLAFAVCLKLTPLLFAVYWLYQRNWRLLLGLAAALVVTVLLVPAAALGPALSWQLTGSWLGNLILPALVKGKPFPAHINQSLSGVFSRLFMHGNIFHNPDDSPGAEKFHYISFVSLSPEVGRYVLLGLKLAIVAVMAWAIGWRRLPREDARRGLHYGLVAAGMLILNQRSWDHHAVILLIAYLGIWYALAYGRFARPARITCLVWVFVAGVPVWVMGKSLFVAFAGSRRGREIANLVEAYGPTFWHFALIFALCVVLLRLLRATDLAGELLYAPRRQPLRPRQRPRPDQPA